MQIKLDKVTYKNLSDLSFEIENEKITGIVCNDIKDLININYLIKNNLKTSGVIKYNPKYSKNKIGVVSISKLSEFINGNLYDYLDIKNIDDDLLELFSIDKNIENRDINTFSNTEKIKFLFLKTLIKDYDTILINGIFEELDISMRKKFIKIIINLKKFQKKTILISTTDIDIIYEFIDNLVIILDGKSLSCSNKFSIYEEDNIVNNPLIQKPFIKKIEDMVYNKSNIDLGNNDSINELIKSIYREIR